MRNFDETPRNSSRPIFDETTKLKYTSRIRVYGYLVHEAHRSRATVGERGICVHVLTWFTIKRRSPVSGYWFDGAVSSKCRLNTTDVDIRHANLVTRDGIDLPPNNDFSSIPFRYLLTISGKIWNQEKKRRIGSTNPFTGYTEASSGVVYRHPDLG